jgi:hypothetical protein
MELGAPRVIDRAKELNAMDKDFSEALKVVLNAVREGRAHLKSGELTKALREFEDPLFASALEEVELYLQTAV